MATRDEYKKMGYTDDQINKAISASAFSGQPVNVAPANTPVNTTANPTAPEAPKPVTNEPVVNKPVATAPEPVKTETVQPTVTQPVEPAPIKTVSEPVKTETATAQTVKTEQKPVKTVNYDTSAGRESEIVKNLNDFFSQWITDPEQIRASAGYQTADEGKKKLVDAFVQAKTVKTDEGWFNEFVSGREAFNPSRMSEPDYRIAKSRFDAIKSIRWLSDADISSQYRNGSISPKALEDLGKVDPVKYKNVLTINRINGGAGTNVVKSEESATSDIMSAFNSLFSKKDETSIKDSIYSDPEIRASLDKKNALAQQITDLNAQMEKIDDEVDAELEGTGATSSRAAALKSSRKKAILREIVAKEASYNNALSSMQDMVGWKLKDIERADKAESEKRGFAEDLLKAQFGQQLALSTKQKEFEQQMSQKAAIAKDPTLATQDLIDNYRKIGVLAQRSDADIVSDIQKQVSEGKPLGQALSELNKVFQSKPEYSAYKAKQFPTEKAELKEYNGRLYQVSKDGTLTEVTPSSALPTETPVSITGWSFDFRDAASKYPNEASVKNNNPAGITYNETFANTLRNSGVQFSIGTARPKAEGGNYFMFPNVEEGFKAYDILWSSPKYQNLTVWQALKRWGTGALPWVNVNKKVSDLTDGELEQLQAAQIKKEAPGMYKELVSRGILTPQGREFTRWQAQSVTPGEYSTVQKAAMDEFISNPNAKWAEANLSKFGLNTSDVNAYGKMKVKEESEKAKSKASEKPLGTDAWKVVAYTTTGMQLADKLSNTLKSMSARDFILKVKARDPKIFNDVRLLADSIIRLRTGAAATTDEVDTFAGGLASVMNLYYNDKNSIQEVIDTYKSELSNARRSVSEGASSIISWQTNVSVPDTTWFGWNNPLGLNLPGF